jgi:superfamily I DNA/RNA helicase
METLLTGIQFQTLSEIEAEERVVIEGGAGTGKTVIACESAIRSAELGRKTLLCCVGEALLNDFKMRIKGVSNNLKIVSVSEAIRMVEKFETIIIDESQDVDWEYWDKLEGMLENKDSKLVCFMDANQAIYRVATDLVVRLGAKRNTLRVNMRNTKRIAVVVERLYQGPFLTTAGPEGTEPKISFFTNSDEVINEICTEISSLRNIEGVELSDIAVLSNDKEFLRKLRFALTNSRIMHCPAGNRVLSAVVVDSVLNFKGLESSVVLLHSLNEEGNDRELSYVGTSRARNYLHIYASDRNSIIAKALI